jgi:CubicO group peptidase (beta-lactamase class C family)
MGAAAPRRIFCALLLSLPLLLSACAHPLAKPERPSPAAVASARADRLAADSPRTTQNGATFTAPGGWAISGAPSLVLLEPPEADSKVAIVSVKAANANDAVAAAWTAYRPDAQRPLRVATPRPARDGWEERHVFDFETSPNERMTVFAVAMRSGDSWTVMLVDATDPTFERRQSQIVLMRDSLRPKGYVRESFAGRTAQPLDAGRIAKLEQFIVLAQEQLRIPGVGLGLVQGGHIIFEGGFGVRELGGSQRVDANTRFLVASNTKAMTTLLLAKLVDADKLAWEMPVTQAYPAFKLGSAETTREVRLKHLVCACTGLPRQDMEWLFQFRDATPESIMQMLETIQPTTKFGEVYQYSNNLAAAAGYVAAHTLAPGRELGAAYDEGMEKLIFGPLEMTSSTFDFAVAMAGNLAQPHADDVDGHVARARMDINYAVVPIRPAGGMWTNVHDLLHYVQMELAGGMLPDGKRYVSTENLLARRAPQVAYGENAWYGMGLETDRTWGVAVVHHGGSMIGYKSDMLFLPDYGVGAVLLTNSDNGVYMLRPFMRRLLEVLFDGKPEAQEDVAYRAQQITAELAKARERLVIPADPAIAARTAATYRSAELGQVAVFLKGGALIVDVGEWQSAVASRLNDDGTHSLITIDPGYDGFEFVVGDRAGKRILTLRDSQHEYVLDGI